jgi:prepilin-type N-terminal cleavage/methylation domain-containing protein
MLEGNSSNQESKMKNQTSQIKNQTSIGGFTLIEVLIATVLIGLSIAALVGANGSFSMANVSGADLSTAEFLVEQIRELTTMLPLVDPTVPSGPWTLSGPQGGETVASYNDVSDFKSFDSATLGAPIDAQRNPLTALAAFQQKVTVQKVSKSNFDQTLADTDLTSNFARVTVTILQNGRQIISASWIRARY